MGPHHVLTFLIFTLLAPLTDGQQECRGATTGAASSRCLIVHMAALQVLCTLQMCNHWIMTVSTAVPATTLQILQHSARKRMHMAVYGPGFRGLHKLKTTRNPQDDEGQHRRDPGSW